MRMRLRGCARIVLVLAVVGCVRSSGEPGNGEAKTEVRTPGAFHGVQISGAFTTEIAVAPDAKEPRIELSGDGNLLPLVETEVRAGMLEIGARRSLRPKLPLVARITAPSLDAISATGANDVVLRGMRGDNLTVHLSGASDVRGDGTVKTLAVEVTGTGDLALDQLAAEDVRVVISGAGDAAVAASRSLDVQISGAGNVSYRGDPQVTRNITGAGSLAKR